MRALVTQLCPVLCDPMDCSPPGSSVHGILQARILEWVAIPFSKGFSQPRDQWVDHNAGILNCRQILYRLSQQGSSGRTAFNPKGQSKREPLRLLPGKSGVSVPFLILPFLPPGSCLLPGPGHSALHAPWSSKSISVLAQRVDVLLTTGWASWAEPLESP